MNLIMQIKKGITYLKDFLNRKQPSTSDHMNKIQENEEEQVRNKIFTTQQSIITGNIKNSTINQIFIEKHLAVPLVDNKINNDIEIIRKSRFFTDFDVVHSSLELAKRLIEGELSGGSHALRCRAIAWCSRLLTIKEKDKAEEILKFAKTLGSCPEIKIAEAFICLQKGEKEIALSILAKLNLPISRSAALMIVINNEGAQAAVSWLANVGFNAADLDSDGKYFLMSLHLQLSQWEAALSCLDALTKEDLQETPGLHHMVAITHLINVVPNELRTAVLNQVPFEAATFPLASDSAALEIRRKALGHFVTASKVALQFNCARSAMIFEDFALWLELRDYTSSEQGKQKLKEKLRNPESALRLVHFGLQFGIKLDLDAVDREIERQITLHGGITYDAAIARFALAFTQKKPEDIANYITRHREELLKYFDKKYLQFLQLEMFSQAGMPERANECLNTLKDEGLTEAEENRLQRIIAEIEGTNPIEILKEHFRKSDSLGDLLNLVEELETRSEWDDLCEYGEILFARTRSLRDAERLARALNYTQKNERLTELLRTNIAFLAQSEYLHMLFCWSLYNAGDLLEARSELSKLSNELDTPNYRALQIHIGIALGDWNSLTAFVSNEYLKKDKRSAQELIGTAQLAHYLGSPDAKELIFSAVEKGNDDAGVLAAAYFLATSAGWEDDVEVSQWLNKAAMLSGDDGPIQMKSLKDVLEMKPDWERRESETLHLLNCGNIAMFLAAESLNRSLIHLMLFSALANLLENDPRRRGAVFAFNGKRQSMLLNNRGTVAVDATVLLTLSFLKLLDKALDSFDTVYIPHSTLKWLFEEKQKASFHQPSRIRDARRIQHFLSTGVLEKLMLSTVPDSMLSAQIGDKLALLIAEAKKAYIGDTQCIVVRPYPVHRIATLMEEEADLTEYADVLSSCQAIVDKLRKKGQITAEEEKKALVYLRFHEKPWPNQPEISDGAILYLDDLAITYFLHLGILEKLKIAGFRSIASPRELSEANELISYESTSEKIKDVIEHIRIAVNLRIESGKIKVGKKHNISESKKHKHSIGEHLTFELIALAKDCKAILVDDRFINQHEYFSDGSSQTPIFTTLDLIDSLVSIESITAEDRLEYRTILRRAGYCCMPVCDEELAYHLTASVVNEHNLIETAELKAIRESILHVRMRNWLQIPKEALWLDVLMKTFVQVLHELWRSDADLSSIRVRSNWIITQIDMRSWAHTCDKEEGNNIAKNGLGMYIMLLLLPPVDLPLEIEEEYWRWIEDTLLTSIKEQYPDIFSRIIEWYQKQVTDIAEKEFFEGATK
jgi:hypothetical protein